ncbi:MAG: SDR family oxidoreductase [Candidatus Dadabacteria bacterium]|nr:SDR family oxidoreductase [Candidatus Dadabacteria bacterium]
MKVFVTGGTGFIGGHLIKRLLRDGACIKALVRDSSKAEELRKLGVEIIIGDVTDKTSITGMMKGCDTFYHLGNVSRWWLSDKTLYYKINVEGTKNVMMEALKEGIKKVVYTSSLSGIRQPKGEIATEETEHKRDFESHYGRSKFLAEREVLRMYRESGLPVVILNPGVVIGPGDLKTFGRTIIELLNGKLEAIIFEDSIIPLVYIDDTVEGHIIAGEKGRIGDKYIIVGVNVKMVDVFKIINKITGVPLPEKRISPLVIKLIAYISELKSLFTGKPPRLALDAVRAMEIGALGENRKARAELGLQFTPLEEALIKTIEWYKENGYVV